VPRLGRSSWTRPCPRWTASGSSTSCPSPRIESSSRTRTSRTPTGSIAARSTNGHWPTPARGGSVPSPSFARRKVRLPGRPAAPGESAVVSARAASSTR
jgi:hypothetical protein